MENSWTYFSPVQVLTSNIVNIVLLCMLKKKNTMHLWIFFCFFQGYRNLANEIRQFYFGNKILDISLEYDYFKFTSDLNWVYVVDQSVRNVLKILEGKTYYSWYDQICSKFQVWTEQISFFFFCFGTGLELIRNWMCGKHWNHHFQLKWPNTLVLAMVINIKSFLKSFKVLHLISIFRTYFLQVMTCATFSSNFW